MNNYGTGCVRQWNHIVLTRYRTQLRGSQVQRSTDDSSGKSGMRASHDVRDVEDLSLAQLQKDVVGDLLMGRLGAILDQEE